MFAGTPDARLDRRSANAESTGGSSENLRSRVHTAVCPKAPCATTRATSCSSGTAWRWSSRTRDELQVLAADATARREGRDAGRALRGAAPDRCPARHAARRRRPPPRAHAKREPGDSAGSKRSFSRQRHSLIAYDAGARLAVDAENLHQLRVASRRVRAFLRVARELVDARLGRRAERGAAPARYGQAARRATSTFCSSTWKSEAPTLGAPDSNAALQLIRMLERDRDERAGRARGGARQRARTGRCSSSSRCRSRPPRSRTERTLAELAARELRRVARPGARARKGTRGREAARAANPRKARPLRGRARRASRRGRTERVIGAATSLQDVLGGAPGCGRRRAANPRGWPNGATIPRSRSQPGGCAERQRQRRDALEHQLPAAWRRLRKLAHGL